MRCGHIWLFAHVAKTKNITCFGSQNVRFGRVVSKSTLIIWSAFTPTSQNDVQEAIDAARKDHEGKEKAEDEEEEQDAHDEDKVEPDPKKLKVNDE